MIPGPQKPYVTYLPSNTGLVGSLGNLASKINDCTATRNDYIDVLKDLTKKIKHIVLQFHINFNQERFKNGSRFCDNIGYGCSNAALFGLSGNKTWGLLGRKL